MLDNGVGLELSFAEQIRLVLADVIWPELVRSAVEISREFVNGTQITARRAARVVSTLEFLEHHLSKMGLLDTADKIPCISLQPE